MMKLHSALGLTLSGLIVLSAAGIAKERDRVASDFKNADANHDGKLSREEWNRRGNFQRLDTDHDGALSLAEVRAMYAGHGNRSYDWPPKGFVRSASETDPSAAADLVEKSALDRKTLCGIGRGRKCKAKPSIKRGLLATGLGPVFPKNAICHGIDDTFGLDYGFKRSREAYHGGIDMPARWGTPMIAAAAGTVVGKFRGERSARGIEIVLRHAPADTGLAVWTYTQYAHMDKMPDLKVGARVRLGETLGPTGNSGVSGKTRQQSTTRRPAIHFVAFFAETEKYANQRDIIMPVDGRWMDPLALYRAKPPFDSQSLKAVSSGEKDVPVSVMFEDGAIFPAGAKIVWPYRCGRE